MVVVGLNNRDNYEYTRFLAELLKSHRNPQAAKELNIKYISVLNTSHFHGNLDGIYKKILKQCFRIFFVCYFFWPFSAS